MRPGSYGYHAELGAQALNHLLTTDELPHEKSIDQMLHCRDAVIGALRQRLVDLGMPPRARDFNPPPLPASFNLAGVDNKLITLLDSVLSSTALMPDYRRKSPLEMLGTRSTDPTTETWRTAAVELLAASNALAAAATKPWLLDGGSGWYLVRDLAVATEATTILDARLQEVGLLHDLDRINGGLDLDGMRLITSQAARVAGWYATSPDADLAMPRRQREPTPTGMPVTLVTGVEDLAPAQRRLARFLRPQTATNSAYNGEPQISADSARQLIASQLHLCTVFADSAARSVDTTSVVDFFRDRAAVLVDLQTQVRHLVDVNPYEPQIRRFWQQGEITTATARLQNQPGGLGLRPAEFWAIAAATHDVTNNLGQTLRRELLREASNLRDAHPRHEDGPKRITRKSRLESRLTDLIHLPAAPQQTPTTINLQRAALQTTLDQTRTLSDLPSPFPALRTPRSPAISHPHHPYRSPRGEPPDAVSPSLTTANPSPSATR